MSFFSQCAICVNFLLNDNGIRKCKAFPEGIPEKYYSNSFEPPAQINYMKTKYNFEISPHLEIDPGQIGNYVFEKLH